jgi:Fe(3+) dicitrate transport protein
MQAFEILKGGSQIQYGPYTTGGAINMVSTDTKSF